MIIAQNISYFYNMGLAPYQIIVPILAVYFILRMWTQLRRQKRSGFSFIIWLIWWAAVILVCLLPDSLTMALASWFGFKDNVHAFIFVCLGILFLFTIYYSSTIERLQRQLSQMIRDQAIQDAKMDAQLRAYKEWIQEHQDTDQNEDTLRA